MIDRYIEKEAKVNSVGNQVDQIVGRFYKESYERLSAEIADNTDKMSLNDLYTQSYTKELFKLIIDVIKNKDISDEEKLILKEFLQEQYAFIKQDSLMESKFDEVLD